MVEAKAEPQHTRRVTSVSAIPSMAWLWISFVNLRALRG
jgi:hypothetical protein